MSAELDGYIVTALLRAAAPGGVEAGRQRRRRRQSVSIHSATLHAHDK
jgi:hypothetical protein